MMDERPMIWFYCDPDPVRPVGIDVPPPPPPPARGGNAPARGEVMLANEGLVLPNDASVVDWLNQAPGSRSSDVRVLDAIRRRNARRDPNQMDTSSGRDIVPWQFQDIPPRLVPGLLTYAEIVKKCSSIQEFSPICTPRVLTSVSFIRLTRAGSVTSASSSKLGNLNKTMRIVLLRYSLRAGVLPMLKEMLLLLALQGIVRSTTPFS